MTETYKLQIIDDSKFDICLEKVRFDSINIPEDLPDDTRIKLRTKDSYKILKLTDKKIDLEFKREKFFEPAGFFTIEVILTITYRLKPLKDKENEKEKIIEEDLKNHYYKLLAPAATRASILVSALTSIDLKSPIVDPPYFITEDDEE